MFLFLDEGNSGPLFTKTSYRQILFSLKAATLDIIMIGIAAAEVPAALLPRCLSNSNAIRKV